MDVPPYRDHPLANLVHGLIHYYQWFELVKREVEQESERRVFGNIEREDMDCSEGVGENEDVLNNLHTHEGYTHRLDDDLLSLDTLTSDSKKIEGKRFMSSQRRPESLPHIVKEETLWNIDDEAEEDSEKSYLKKARVLYSKDLDERLFPFRLPRHYLGIDYVLPMQTATQRNSHSTAIKHLRDTLSLEQNSTAALLPLVQLMLAGADLEGAYSEIDKCCQKFSDCASFRMKCMLLESLTPKNREMLISAYEEVLTRDPLSVLTLERLMDMHKAGDYSTEALLQHLVLHLDSCPGSVLIWRKLASCFYILKKADVEDVKEGMEINDDAVAQDICDFLHQESLRDEWKLREYWWLVKHFQEESIEEEMNLNGIQWLLYKAAVAAHIYGPHMQFVLYAEKNLQAMGNYPHLEKLQRHKNHSFRLLAHLKNRDDAKGNV